MQPVGNLFHTKKGCIMIEIINDGRHILAHVRQGKVGPVEQLLRKICEVGGDEFVKPSLLICMVERLEPVGEEAKGR